MKKNLLLLSKSYFLQLSRDFVTLNHNEMYASQSLSVNKFICNKVREKNKMFIVLIK